MKLTFKKITAVAVCAGFSLCLSFHALADQGVGPGYEPEIQEEEHGYPGAPGQPEEDSNGQKEGESYAPDNTGTAENPDGSQASNGEQQVV